MVLGIVRQEAGSRERWLKALKAKLAQGGSQAQVHSDQIVLMMARQEAGPHERRPKAHKEELENNSRKPRDPVGKQA
jgi:hypothetical protein